MMLHLSLYLLLITISSPTTTIAAPPPYTATDYILLNCGAPSNSTDDDSRSWDGDALSKYVPSNSPTSLPLRASMQHSSVSQVPYMTARVFQSPFTYTFPVLNGPKFLRLYFYPTAYSTFDSAQSYFSLTANNFTLLTNFSAFLNSDPSNPSFMKEYVINVEESQKLVLTFSPNPNSFAFVNGIEIVSMPDKLYLRGDDQPVKFVNEVRYLENDTALENIYRLNAGGSLISIRDDSGPNGMFRAWNSDVRYLFGDNLSYTPSFTADQVQIKHTRETPPYIAPELVYKTSRVIANLSSRLDWEFRVDSGFYYLLRLHFCELQKEVTLQNQRVFTIQVNNETEEIEADVIQWTGGPGIPVYKDYMAWIPYDRNELQLSMFPNMEGDPKWFNALLNGLEIFKISNSSNSLAARSNPGFVPDTSSSGAANVPVRKSSSKVSSMIYAVIGGVIGVVAVIAVVSFLILRRRRKVKDSGGTNCGKSSWMPLSSTSRSTTRTSGSSVQLPSDLCRRFLLEEMKSATNNFDDVFVIGRGGFGNVYKGCVDDGSTNVAIKRLNATSNQGVREFLTEIDMLSKLRHLHLVSLLGYCDENGEMILVYDYMSHGTLREHLYSSNNSPLNWKQRLQICIGAAKGLHYLHTSAKQTIIHRDVKSTNILLDEKFVAKVSDFGLSRVGPTGGANTHVSTTVKGSFGYVDPEYYRRQQLTDKSDVYSFGVVLFEVLCARPAVIPSLPKEQVNLAEWAKLCSRKGIIEQIIDHNLDDKIAPECLSKFVETAVMCVRDKGMERPAMSDIVWSLEFAMQLQEAAEKRGGDGAEIGGGFTPMNSTLLMVGEPNTTDDEEMFSGSSVTQSKSKSSGLSSSNSDKLNTGDIFSEILNPIGR